MRRRYLLASLGTTFALAGCAGSDGESSPTATNETPTSGDSTGTPNGGMGAGVTLSHHTEYAMAKLSGGVYSSSRIYLDAAGIPIGGADSYQFRVRDDADNAVTVVPNEESSQTLEGVLGLDLYMDDGGLLDEPELYIPDGESVPVSVSGDTEMFEEGAVFRAYTVDALDGSEVAASTAPRTYGVGYESAVTQDSTSGTIELRMPAPDAYTDSWVVQLEIKNDPADGESRTQVKQPFEYQSGEFVTSFDAESVAPISENGRRNSDLLFHADGNTETTANLWAEFDLELS